MKSSDTQTATANAPLLEEWFAHSEELVGIISEFSDHLIMAPDTPHDKEVAKVIAFRFAQVVRTYRAVITLSRAGDGANAYILMRVLFEALVDVAFLTENPKDVWRYLEEAAVLEGKLRGSAAKYGPPQHEKLTGKRPSPEHLRGQFSSLAEQQSNCKSWRRLSLRARAEKSGFPDLVELYELVYPTASAFVHGGSGILLDYLRGAGRGPQEFRVEYSRTDHELEPALGLSSLVFLRFVALLDNQFRFGLRPMVERLRVEQDRLLEASWTAYSERYIEED